MSHKAFLALLLASTSAPLMAADAADTAEGGDIIVTAQHREQRVTEVPISLSVVSGAQAAESGASSTLDLARLVPGLSIGQNSGDGDFPFISLRGVAMRDFADTNESPSAVYVNEFYKANLMGLDSQMFDISRIEVLRGPQGTLYGRNATGGLIHFIAAAPTEQLEGHVSVTFAERNRVQAEAAISGRLFGNLLGRVSVFRHRYDGYIKNNFPGGEDGNALNASAIRGQLSNQFADNLSAELFVQYYKNDNEAGNMFTHIAVTQDPVTGLSTRNPGGVDSFGYGDSKPLETNTNFDAYMRSEQFTAIGKIKADLGFAELTSITGFEKGKKDAAFDSDSTPGARSTEVHPRAEQFSQELRLAGVNGPLTWVTGLYYFDYNVNGYQRRTTSAAAGPRRPVYYDLDSESWAIFGNVDYALTSTLTATGGVRYTEEDKEYDLNNTDTGPVFNTTTVGDLAKRNDDSTSFTARLSWAPQRGQLFYAGVARSFKAGTFNVGYTSLPLSAISVRPERLTSYEAGAKFATYDNRYSISGAVFHYQYKDSQAYQFDGVSLSSTTFNRDAEITGAEAEFAAEPVQNLRLRGSLTYLDAKLLDVQLPGLANNGPVVDRRMPLAPKWSWNLTANYRVPNVLGGTLGLQGDIAYKGVQYFDAFNSPSQREAAYALSNVRLSWTDASDSLTLAVFAENVTDKRYRTAAFDLAFLGMATEVWGRPRWIGGSISYRFGS
ncbi:iron complex outermembrane receptor protein [Sphingobium sp. B2D3A]|uniref:TonB-dependent receptor n=1 Tax=unclassified Sphingobium TaxID=2611147 RepID=UPI0022253FC7|nr:MULTISPECIES: TonB-dependent receptor [unclassified Sphingobium]MCW2337054.1 iron complex outermembrane receptor protein [Sphingobium sp. B2D3A]MCW2351287.1 iron complex outermembrane receptor protein [Sphingobium sp. B12D2B]MCW2365413.1 iron complex outermembrane receptor protein [Sphingobium sp. B7D2B]MCW2386807.1 iron complex outermembrane receptor protein [Sphingobium sp. B2D3D]MCW2388950.1 iron complex outermembrane receptor protein [Sphingobium sp. B11D3B]